MKLIAVLKYTDCLQDGKNVFRVLANRNVEVIKTRQGISIYPNITIRINDQNELSQLLSDLNRNCTYEVRLVKIKAERSFKSMYFIAFVVCVIAAIWQGYCGNVGFCLLEVGLALINLPQSIKWVKELFEN